MRGQLTTTGAVVEVARLLVELGDDISLEQKIRIGNVYDHLVELGGRVDEALGYCEGHRLDHSENDGHEPRDLGAHETAVEVVAILRGVPLEGGAA